MSLFEESTMAQQFVIDLGSKTIPATVGNKANGLHTLQRKGFRIPETLVCTWEAHQQYQQGKGDVLHALRKELELKLKGNRRYAVRSSANAEDGMEHSFAGQFDSLLDVQDVDNILEAIQRVWESSGSANLEAYVEQVNFSKAQLRMAVIIQEMVNSVVSGVSFSKNPMTGLDEIVVEAVEGTGASLVQAGSTPDRWVYKWGDWVQQPKQTPIALDLIAEVAAQTVKIAQAYKAPLDLEWVYDGTAVYWVQVREITTLGNLNIYSNRISREFMPGLIKPLVWSVNTSLVNSAWVDLFTELIGPNDIDPKDLSKSFHYQAYFNMGTIGRIFSALGMAPETLEIMMGLEGGDQRPRFRPGGKAVRHLPRMVKFALAKLRYGQEIDALLPEIDRTYAAFAAQALDEMPAKELLNEIDALLAFTRKTAYTNIIGPLLMQLYNGLLRANLKKVGIDLEQVNLSLHVDGIDEFNPNVPLDELHTQYRQFNQTVQEQIAAGSYADFQAMTGIEALQTAVSNFITQFGHLSDSGNDFSKRPWRENPDLVLQMIVNHKHHAHHGPPDEHHQVEKAKPVYQWETLPISRLKRWRLGWQYRRARQFRYYRETISFKYTYGYSLLRKYFLALANHLIRQQIIKEHEDIFYLYKAEVQAIVNEQVNIDYWALIQARKQELKAAQELLLPEIIYGEQAPPLETYETDHERLSGIPTSGGYYQGPVRVIQSLSEFEKMRPGDVLVIPFSDVSWTPLFAKAGAVIAESGGILSHSSIVAREYKVPAVVSVTGACRILEDDLPVTVDGFKGEVILNRERHIV
jgi:phosphohistidine swiveling domain-containing protein